MNQRQINRAQEERITEVRKWMLEDGPCTVFPPYPIVADREGNLFRLYIGVPTPEGWLIVGLNCEKAKDLPFTGDRRKDGSR